MSANDVRVEIYRSFVEEGRAPTTLEISHRLDQPIEDVARSFRELDGQDVIALVPNTDFIWLAHPFSAMHAPFRVFSDDRTWDAICVWDALGVLALTQRSGRVETTCPDCGEALTVTVTDDSIEDSDHVVHFEVPARRWYDNIGYT
jgi:Alkylmercury lyase